MNTIQSDALYTISDEQRLLLNKHLELIIEANERVNVTHITDWEQGQLLHIEDSLQALPEINHAPKGLYCDLGSGGGFPGIPLAITTKRKTILVESVAKKTTVLDSILSQLGLNNQISTYTGRAESLALDHPLCASVITARALSSLPSLLELAVPLLQTGGQLICFKGVPDAEEINQATQLKDKLGLELTSSRTYTLSDGKTNRSLYVFTKVAESSVKLPRRPGMAQKRPYK